MMRYDKDINGNIFPTLHASSENPDFQPGISHVGSHTACHAQLSTLVARHSGLLPSPGSALVHAGVARSQAGEVAADR